MATTKFMQGRTAEPGVKMLRTGFHNCVQLSLAASMVWQSGILKQMPGSICGMELPEAADC